MKIFLLRHGIAVEEGHGDPQKDAARALTAEGRRKLRSVARAMKAMGLTFDLLLSSPLVRARQTAELIRQELATRRKVRLTAHLAPGAKPAALVRELTHTRPRPKSILLVGHEPDMSRLASLWLSGNPGLSLTLKKAGLCQMDIEHLGAGRCATLEWWLPPRLSGLMK